MSELNQVSSTKRISDYFFPILASGIGVLILTLAQFGVIMGFGVIGIDYDKYEGTFSFIYAIIAIVALLGFSKISRLFYLDHKSGLLLKKPAVSEVWMTIVVALGLLGIVTVYMVIVSNVAESMASSGSDVVAEQLEQYEAAVDRYTNVEVDAVPVFDKFLNYLSVAILIPIAEEILFRGIVLGHFLKRYPAAVAIIISAVIFGVMHGISIHIGYALISGLVIGSMYYFTQNIMMSSLIHMIFNFFGGTLSLILTDGWLKISEETSNVILSAALEVQLFAVTPATVCFIILMVRKIKMNKSAISNNTQVVEEEVVTE